MKIAGDLEGKRLAAISHPQVLTSKNKRKNLLMDSFGSYSPGHHLSLLLTYSKSDVNLNRHRTTAMASKSM